MDPVSFAEHVRIAASGILYAVTAASWVAVCGAICMVWKCWLATATKMLPQLHELSLRHQERVVDFEERRRARRAA